MNNKSEKLEPPFVSTTLFILSALAFIGGLFLAFIFWPGDAEVGYSWKAAAYAMSITWFMAGLIQAVFFVAVGKIIIYLNEISENTKKSA